MDQPLHFSVKWQDILDAADRLQGHVDETPLIRSDIIDYITGKSVWFKPECLQKVGAFKYRGAYNRLSALSAADRQKGVVAFSSGNHALGIARAARELDISAIIVMPEDAPRVKVDGVIRYGAEIRFYDRATESRETIAKAIAVQSGRILVPSYDDPYIIAGQGTVGLEIAEAFKVRQLSLDALIVPMGGGGLCAGTSIALKNHFPVTRIYGAEPAAYDDHRRALMAGKIIELKDMPPTLCDALMTPRPGDLTFPINQQLISGVFKARDHACLRAMAVLERELGVRTEPSGAIGLAVLLSGALDQAPGINTVCVVLSGGNVDPAIRERALAYLP